MKFIRSIIRFLKETIFPAKKPLNRSQLLGMYLNESNHHTQELYRTRQRRDGTHAQARNNQK